MKCVIAVSLLGLFPTEHVPGMNSLIDVKVGRGIKAVLLLVVLVCLRK